MSEESPTEVIEQSVDATEGAAPRRRRRLPASFWLGLVLGVAASVAVVLSWPFGGRRTQSTILPWTTPTRLASDLPAFSLLRVDAQCRSIALPTSIPSSLDPGRSAKLAVLDPNGKTELEQTLETDQLQRGMIVLVLRSDRPLASGAYVVRFTQDGLPDPIEFRFELQRD